MKFIKVAIAAGIAAVAMNNAYAVDANATMAVSGLGTSSYTGGNLNSATTFNFGSSGGGKEFLITGVPALAFGNANDFAAGATQVPELGTGDSALSINISAFSAINSFWTWSSGTTSVDRYSFDLLTLTRNASASGAMDLYGTGTFHDADGDFASSAASIRITAQEIAGSTSWSASWATPPFANTTGVPEPASLALLGMGAAGWAAGARRKAAK